MKIEEFQKIIKDIYLERDSSRGIENAFMWLTEEIGELARAIRDGKNLTGELADCCAWLFSIANILQIDMEDALKKYKNGCPKCGKTPCVCPRD